MLYPSPCYFFVVSTASDPEIFRTRARWNRVPVRGAPAMVLCSTQSPRVEAFLWAQASSQWLIGWFWLFCLLLLGQSLMQVSIHIEPWRVPHCTCQSRCARSAVGVAVFHRQEGSNGVLRCHVSRWIPSFQPPSITQKIMLLVLQHLASNCLAQPIFDELVRPPHGT